MFGTLFKLGVAVSLVLAALGLSLPLAYEASAVVAPGEDVVVPDEGIPTVEPLPLAPPLPDLTVTFEYVRTGRTTPAGDSIWQLNYTVTNIGTAAANPFLVRLYSTVMEDKTTKKIVGRDLDRIEPFPGGLGPGESRSFSIVLPDDRPCEFDRFIVVDERFPPFFHNAVVESNENNNGKCSEWVGTLAVIV